MLAALGFLMIIGFTILILTKRVTPFTGLVTASVVAGLLGGFGLGLGKFAVEGLESVASTALMISFAVMYFGLMSKVGLFDPLIKAIIKLVKGDPLKVIVGTVILCTVVAFDGDGTSTVLIVVTAMLPLYKRLGISPVILLALGTTPISILNLVPWGGPSARVMTALKLDADELFLPLLPAMAGSLIFLLVAAFWIGKRERARLGITHVDDQTLAELAATIVESDMEFKRPKMFWYNLVLTVFVVLSLLMSLVPSQIVFVIGLAVALMVNYPQVKIQKKLIETIAPNAFNIVLMIAGAGIFTGILTGTKMSDAMATSIIAIIPDALGPHLAVFTALLSAPGTFFLSNDAFYLGILPILAETAAIYGITPQEIGLASLLGQPFHGLSPLVPAVYLACGLADVNLIDYQKSAAKYCAGMLLVTVLIAGFTGAIPF